MGRAAALLLLLSAAVVAEVREVCPKLKPFYSDAGRGWYWGEECVTVEDSNETNATAPPQSRRYRHIPKRVSIPWREIDRIDPRDIAKIEEEARSIAIAYPTDENVAEWKRLTKYIYEKAFRFTTAQSAVTRTDTELARWASEVPVTEYAISAYRSSASRKKKELIERYRERAGLVVIVQKGCDYCVRQMPILEMFREETGMHYKIVDMHALPTAVAKLGVSRTPDIFLVLKKDGRAMWQRIASGLNTKKELEDAVVFGLYALREIKSVKDYR